LLVKLLLLMTWICWWLISWWRLVFLCSELKHRPKK
jgi:hypothetical protein